MRKIDLIVIHCAATKPNQDIGRAEIDRWHRERGWLGIGYHYVIRRDGRVENGRPLEKAGAHVQGLNANSIGICLVGGLNAKGQPAPEFTAEQWDALETLVRTLKKQFPNARIAGHNEFAAKACPSFNVQEWRKDIGI